MKTIETMAEAIMKYDGQIAGKSYYEEITKAALQSIHEPDPHAVAIVADRLQMDATKVAAVWMLMVEEMGK